MDEVSLSVVGLLGGASRQAVHKSGDPGKWLKARVRRALCGARAAEPGRAVALAEAGAEALCRAARARLGERRAGGRGRPACRSAAGLGRLLGAAPMPGEQVGQLFDRWVRDQVRALRRAARPCARGRGAVARWLDGVWLPRWVRRGGAAPGADRAPAAAAPQVKPAARLPAAVPARASVVRTPVGVLRLFAEPASKTEDEDGDRDEDGFFAD